MYVCGRLYIWRVEAYLKKGWMKTSIEANIIQMNKETRIRASEKSTLERETTDRLEMTLQLMEGW